MPTTMGVVPGVKNHLFFAPVMLPTGTRSRCDPPLVLADAVAPNKRWLYWAKFPLDTQWFAVNERVYVPQPDAYGQCPSPLSWAITRMLDRELVQGHSAGVAYRALTVTKAELHQRASSAGRLVALNQFPWRSHDLFYCMEQGVWKGVLDRMGRIKSTDWDLYQDMTVDVMCWDDLQCNPVRTAICVCSTTSNEPCNCFFDHWRGSLTLRFQYVLLH
jgi:hypothetical protein